ncbi:LacI family DNA-binding transcriptional regulator [Tabrizicola sp. J26]|uniref:LacI family DNA-binding transcriptional regulator n=1 Tax=Alitabrizicola rongguiensis TaxID=2909234 RepID=UPI001F3F3C91|nr:LacI family DNA-binding transcriptional regulator [Tabrizicola rongguiensis]MCF1710727.1 LacI family DNA-binding transcriptional regulator [Tabrizicola rongguiensis]
MAEQSLETVTADDVAILAGVSRWTVARAFKKDGVISDKARAKVMAAATELGYVPDLLAASLASDRSNLVALLVDDFDNPHKLVMLERLTRILREAGYGTLLVNMLGESDGPEALLTASQRRVDAAVVIGTQFDEGIRRTALGAKRVKQLIIFARASTAPGTISISCDDVAAMTEITRHLLEKGFKRPLFLAGPDTESTRLMRKDTFINVWSEEGSDPPPSVIHVPEYSMALACEAVTTRLSDLPSQVRPDVIVCENDVLALGAIDALRHRLGLSVPADVAVTGFDDVPLAASPAYDLTTYRQPVTEMARALVRVLDNGGRDATDVFLSGRFIQRGSS